jgi:hypothetical protein
MGLAIFLVVNSQTGSLLIEQKNALEIISKKYYVIIFHIRLGETMKYSMGILTVFTLGLGQLNANPQQVSGSGITELNSNGTDDGVSFINQNVNESTLDVPAGSVINKKKNKVGIATDANGLGIVNFNGTNNTTTVYGITGDGNDSIDKINIGGVKVVFNGNIHANGINFNNNPGEALLKGTTTLGADGVYFTNGAGKLELDKNVELNGNVFGAESIMVILDDNATINGNVTASLVEYNAQGPDINQGATINGNVSTPIFEIGDGVLAINGNLELNSTDRNVIQLTENNGVAIPINVSETVTVDGAVSVNYRIVKFHAPREGAYNIVNAEQGGTSGASVSIISNDVRFYYVGSNENGNITVTSTKRNTFEPAPLQSTGDMFRALLPVAYEHFDSDLDLIEGQLGFPTDKQYFNALYQIAPNITQAGIGRETFNATRSFLKVFLEHLRLEDDPCCCRCDNWKVWVDGFGFYGHQQNKNHFIGYNVDTWGTTLAVENELACDLSAGLGFGYAASNVKLRQYNDTTKSDHYQGIAYISYNPGGCFFDGGGTFGWNHYKSKREIAFNTIHRNTRATYNGREYTGFFVTGYQTCYQGIDITPFVSLIGSHIHLDSYHEKGAKTLDLKFKKRHLDFIQSGVGLKCVYECATCYGAITPEMHTIWLHDFNTQSPKIKASYSGFAAEGGYFSSRGMCPDQNTWNIGGSVNYKALCNLTFSIIYDYETSRSYFDHEGMLALDYRF